MHKKHWFLLSLVVAGMAVLLQSGRVNNNAPLPKQAKGICCKARVKDCNRKERPGKMILESLPRQFIMVSPLLH